MTRKGGCYCGDIRFEAEGDPVFQGICGCTECQKIAGGGVNFVMALPAEGLKITKGEMAVFARDDLDMPVRRFFCPRCGTHLMAKSPYMPDAYLIKAGAFDDPADYGDPKVSIYTSEMQPWHVLPESVHMRFPTVPNVE